MYEIYTWKTPNGEKPVILLEELGVDYIIKPINITEGDQFTDEYILINPNGKIPALKDGDNFIFESGAILQYLAEKHSLLIPHDQIERAKVLSWCYWQVGGLGPMLGQWAHFQFRDEKLYYPIERYLKETLRLLTVLEKQLELSEYVGGNQYTIADIMSFSWVRSGVEFLKKENISELPSFVNLNRWVSRIQQRDKVVKALDKLDQAINL